LSEFTQFAKYANQPGNLFSITRYPIRIWNLLFQDIFLILLAIKSWIPFLILSIFLSGKWIIIIIHLY